MKHKELFIIADSLVRTVIRKRDKDICQKCKSAGEEVHHIITRRNKMLRFNFSNLILLCSGCHTLNRDSAHKDELNFKIWFSENYPDRWIEIKSLKNISKHWKEYNLKELIKELKNAI